MGKTVSFLQYRQDDRHHDFLYQGNADRDRFDQHHECDDYGRL